MEILMGMAKTSLHGEGCAGLTLGVTGSSQLGSPQLDIDATGAGPQSPLALNIGFNNRGPTFPIDLTPFGLAGCFMYHSINIAIVQGATAAGTATVSLGPVPMAGFLTGAKFYTQYASINSAAPGGVSTSNYARIVIGN